jgi:hypothetical protein
VVESNETQFNLAKKIYEELTARGIEANLMIDENGLELNSKMQILLVYLSE